MTKPALIDIALIAPQLSKLIPLLSSNQDGEVIASARAIGRVLTRTGRNWSDPSQAVGETKRLSHQPSGLSAERQPSALEMVAWCRTHGHGRLSSRGHQFNLTASLALGNRLSARPSEWLRDIYTRLQNGRVS